MVSYQEGIHRLKQFKELFEESKTFEEFHIRCQINDLGDMTTKEFFDNQIFAIMYSDEYRACRREILKFKLFLLNNVKKLNDFYKILN